MHPLIQALLSPWEWRLEILAVLLVLAALYTMGWVRLRHKSRNHGMATRPRLAAYLGGLAILAATLMSPIDRLGGELFFMHMTQHMLSIMIVAPLIMLANPFPFMVWSLPNSLRVRVSSLFARQSAFRRLLASATRPIVAWLVFITVYLGWHDASVYNAALRHDWIHDVQHITFFVAALFFWWHAIGAAPRIHSRFSGWARSGYLIAVVPLNAIVAVSIALASRVVYTHYLSVPRIWGFTAMEDQMWGGAIMWIPGSMMFLLAALIIVARMFGANSPRRAERSDWDGEAAMIAPGLESALFRIDGKE